MVLKLALRNSRFSITILSDDIIYDNRKRRIRTNQRLHRAMAIRSWGDSESFVKGWTVLPSGVYPEKGDVEAYRMQYTNATGHAAIVDSNNSVVGTSDSTGQINRSGFDFRGGVPNGITPVFRRYIGYSH